jgi:hypothetical protein
LYDLQADPNELRNIAQTDPDAACALERQLDTWIREKMEANGLTEDPLTAHGITLGKAWKEQRDKPAL